tara:strand:- start:52 stop:975 length:924 start_codon:yes stop_codon:yes gene_type:complete
VIDVIFKRHIRILKYSNHVANNVNNEFFGFRNELVSDLLIDVRDSMFDDSINRIDKFINKIHVKITQLKKRIEYILSSNLDGLFHNEIKHLSSLFPGLSTSVKRPVQELFGLSYSEHLDSLLLSIKKEVVSNYKVSISYNYPDSFLLEKFRGTRSFNYKNSIFTNYHNKLKSLIKSIISCYSSEIRFFFFHKNYKKFPFFIESSPFPNPNSKKLSNGLYRTIDFSPQKGSSSWKGCLPHFNSLTTQIPLFSLENLDSLDFKNWFSKKARSFQEEVIGKSRLNLFLSGDYSHSQVFDFSRTSITIATL